MKKERRFDVVTVQYGEDLAHAGVKPHRIVIPSVAIDDVFEPRDVEIVLDIERQGILHRPLPAHASGGSARTYRLPRGIIHESA
jgi:hypothetical protein